MGKREDKDQRALPISTKSPISEAKKEVRDTGKEPRPKNLTSSMGEEIKEKRRRETMAGVPRAPPNPKLEKS